MLHRLAAEVLAQTRGPSRNPCIDGKTEEAEGMPTMSPLPYGLTLEEQKGGGLPPARPIGERRREGGDETRPMRKGRLGGVGMWGSWGWARIHMVRSEPSTRDRAERERRVAALFLFHFHPRSKILIRKEPHIFRFVKKERKRGEAKHKRPPPSQSRNSSSSNKPEPRRRSAAALGFFG